MKTIVIAIIFLISLTMFSCVEAAPTPSNVLIMSINIIIVVTTFGYLMFIWERSKEKRYSDEETQ